MGKTRYASVTVKGAETEYLATPLMADTEYAITVVGFTTTGSGPPSRKIAKTNKVPAVTGMFNPPEGVLPYMGYIGMCGPKGYGFLAVLVINRVSILTF